MMSTLLSLPPELLVDVLSHLARADAKAFRSVSHQCSDLATPIIFREVPFHFEPDGCTSLSRIAQAAHLASHVRTIRLQRANGMHRFDDDEAWEQATIYEHQPAEDIFGPSPSPPSDVGLMSHQEWDALDYSARKRLYDEYQQEVQATDEYFARLASAVLAAASPQCTTSLNPHSVDTDALRLLRCYGRASALLRHVQTFSHIPAYRIEALGWGETWRNIAFHAFASVEVGWGHDPYYDAIQLFAALAFSQLSVKPLTHQSLTLTTQGGAFWTVPYLIRILHWMRESPENRESSVPVDHLQVERALIAEGWEYTIEQISGLSRALVTIVQRFASLARLECRVDTLWGDGKEDEKIAFGVAQCIRKAKCLEWLSLAYGEDVHEEHDPSYYFTQNRRPYVARTAATSRYLLGAVASLQHIRHLHLSFHTAAAHLLEVFRVLPHLSSLRISHVALLVGNWDDVLAWIAGNLDLNQAELVVLEDAVQTRPRILLDSRAPAWTSPLVLEHWFDEYREAVLQYVLRKSSGPLVLSPDEYIAKRLPSDYLSQQLSTGFA